MCDRFFFIFFFCFSPSTSDYFELLLRSKFINFSSFLFCFAFASFYDPLSEAVLQFFFFFFCIRVWCILLRWGKMLVYLDKMHSIHFHFDHRHHIEFNDEKWAIIKIVVRYALKFRRKQSPFFYVNNNCSSQNSLIFLEYQIKMTNFFLHLAIEYAPFFFYSR